jgi:hypothetical protein
MGSACYGFCDGHQELRAFFWERALQRTPLEPHVDREKFLRKLKIIAEIGAVVARLGMRSSENAVAESDLVYLEAVLQTKVFVI